MVLSYGTSSCSCSVVALLPSDAVCVDARDARGCASTLRVGCQTSSCCCPACVSLAGGLQLLCC